MTSNYPRQVMQKMNHAARPKIDEDHGVYTLLIRLNSATKLVIRNRTRHFKPGYYVYTGRAMGKLKQRLKRHLRIDKKPHWHIDRLLREANLIDIQVLFTDEPQRECALASEVSSWPTGEPVPHFGASDCRCNSHLSFFTEKPGFSLHTGLHRPFLDRVYSQLEAFYPNHASDQRDPFRTLVTCILSLRTRDPVTDQAAERLFQVFQTPIDFSAGTPEAIADLIYPVGMYRQKARRLISIAQILIDEHGGEVPADVNALTRLPGVGRKTATLVRSFAYHIPAVCVDTHVHRISNRLGLVRTVSPEETEGTLMALLPQHLWSRTNPLLVQHGQTLCKPTRPMCEKCFLREYCNISEIHNEQSFLQDIGFSPCHPSLKSPSTSSKNSTHV